MRKIKFCLPGVDGVTDVGAPAFDPAEGDFDGDHPIPAEILELELPF